jgi:hypothetical protein
MIIASGGVDDRPRTPEEKTVGTLRQQLWVKSWRK